MEGKLNDFLNRFLSIGFTLVSTHTSRTSLMYYEYSIYKLKVALNKYGNISSCTLYMFEASNTHRGGGTFTFILIMNSLSDIKRENDKFDKIFKSELRDNNINKVINGIN